ncbi:MAG: S1/P1 nuclease [Candidatus Binataceae bacterium]
MPLLRRAAVLALTLCLAGVYPADAWWENGHRVIARLAAAHLTPGARARVARILGVPDTPGEVARALARASIWADETKAETGTGAWHFIDLTLQDRKSDIPLRCPEQNCAPARIRLFAAELAFGKAGERWSERDALRYVVHLVGDIHQPMHTVTDADRGGNCERLSEPVDGARNLHAVWDGALVDELGANSVRLAANLESYLEALGPVAERELARGSVDDWVWQSHEIAVQDVYAKLHIPVEPPEFPASCREAPLDIWEFRPPIDSLYLDSMKPVVRDQLVKAGLRLARVLNESL